MMPNGSHELICSFTGSQIGGDRESVRILVREGLKVDVNPRVVFGGDGTLRRVHGCTFWKELAIANGPDHC